MSLLPPLVGIYDISVRDFQFYPYFHSPSKVKKIYDPRISETLIELVNHYFISSPDKVLVYTCDSSDGNFRAKARRALFERWYKNLQDKLEYHEVEIEIENETSVETIYIGVLFRKDFPHKSIIKTQLLDEATGVVLLKFDL